MLLKFDCVLGLTFLHVIHWICCISSHNKDIQMSLWINCPWKEIKQQIEEINLYFSYSKLNSIKGVMRVKDQKKYTHCGLKIPCVMTNGNDFTMWRWGDSHNSFPQFTECNSWIIFFYSRYVCVIKAKSCLHVVQMCIYKKGLRLKITCVPFWMHRFKSSAIVSAHCNSRQHNFNQYWHWVATFWTGEMQRSSTVHSSTVLWQQKRFSNSHFDDEQATLTA